MKKTILIIAIVLVSLGIIGTVGWVIWNNTRPFEEKPPVILTPEQHSFIDEQLENMETWQKVSSMLLFHVYGTDQTAMSSFLTNYQPAGLIFMGDNTNVSDEQLAGITSSLQTNPDLPYLFAVDEEGGIVSRLASDSFPAAISLRDQPASATTEAFTNRTNLLKQVGLNLNFGIIADVTADPNSFIFERVLGTTPNMASERVTAAVQGSVKGTLSSLKHFPGHGETESDSHLAVPVVANVSKTDWLQRVSLPFSAGIKAGANVIMFGHLAYSQIDSKPASLSSVWHQILREELGFKGLTVTDSMSMLLSDPSYSNNLQNYIDTINAGSDLVLTDAVVGGFDVGALIDGITAAVDAGQIPESRINESVRRVLQVRHSLSQGSSV